MSDLDLRDLYKSLQKSQKPLLGPIFITSEGYFINLGENAEHGVVFDGADYDSDDYYRLEDAFDLIKANGGNRFEPVPYIDLWRIPNSAQKEAILDWMHFLISKGRKEIWVNSGSFNSRFDFKKETPEDIYEEAIRKMLLEESADEDVFERNIPIVAYHGSSEDFVRFHSPINWFSSDIDYAKQFAEYASKQGFLYKCEISPMNVLDCGNTSVPCYSLLPIKPYRLSEELLDIINRMGADEKDVRDILSLVAKDYDEPMDGYRMRLHVLTRSKPFADLAKSLGYDALHTLENGGKDCWGVFNSNRCAIVSKEKIK